QTVHAINASTGQENWRTRVGATVGTPLAIAYGIIYFAGFESDVYAVDLSNCARDQRVDGSGKLANKSGRNRWNAPRHCLRHHLFCGLRKRCVRGRSIKLCTRSTRRRVRKIGEQEWAQPLERPSPLPTASSILRASKAMCTRS